MHIGPLDLYIMYLEVQACMAYHRVCRYHTCLTRERERKREVRSKKKEEVEEGRRRRWGLMSCSL